VWGRIGGVSRRKRRVLVKCGGGRCRKWRREKEEGVDKEEITGNEVDNGGRKKVKRISQTVKGEKSCEVVVGEVGGTRD